jgi:hypothetical protein
MRSTWDLWVRLSIISREVSCSAGKAKKSRREEEEVKDSVIERVCSFGAPMNAWTLLSLLSPGKELAK